MTRLSSTLALTTLLALSNGNTLANTQESPVVLTQPSSSAAEAPTPQPGGYSNISNTLLQKMIDEGVAVIDIRREEEWRQTGIIEGVTPITFFTANGQINPRFVPEFTAIAKPDQPVALICRTGNRTQFASRAIAQQLGYKHVYNVTEGITSWIREKRPVVNYE
ncbi:MAG: rhodanese-like domain-containing protein [Granulosicoccaceae bacterium]